MLITGNHNYIFYQIVIMSHTSHTRHTHMRGRIMPQSMVRLDQRQQLLP